MRYWLVVFESSGKVHFRIKENERDFLSAQVIIEYLLPELEKEVGDKIVLSNIIELRK